MSTVDWLKWKATRVICVGGGRAELSLLCLVRLADILCLVARRVKVEELGWRETGSRHHYAGSTRDGSLQDRGTGEY